MLERARALPRRVRLLTALLFIVPATLWLLVVWNTRPYPPEQIAAERERVEALPAYQDAKAACWQFRFASTNLCESYALEALAREERDELSLSVDEWDVNTWSTLVMASLMFLLGLNWPTAAGPRAFLRRVGGALGLGVVAYAIVARLWWRGLELVAQHRNLETQAAWDVEGFTLSSMVLVGLAGTVGVAAAVLFRGPVRGVVMLSAMAGVIGLVMLLAPVPRDPWLPSVNLSAWLHGDESYLDATKDPEPCDPPEPRPLPPIPWNSVMVLVADAHEDPCSRRATHTSAEAAAYLFSPVAGLLALAGITTGLAGRGRGRPGS